MQDMEAKLMENFQTLSYLRVFFAPANAYEQIFFPAKGNKRSTEQVPTCLCI